MIRGVGSNVRIQWFPRVAPPPPTLSIPVAMYDYRRLRSAFIILLTVTLCLF